MMFPLSFGFTRVFNLRPMDEKGRSKAGFSADLDDPFSFAAVCQWSLQKELSSFCELYHTS